MFILITVVYSYLYFSLNRFLFVTILVTSIRILAMKFKFKLPQVKCKMKNNLLFDVSTEFSNLTFSDLQTKYNNHEWLCVYFHWNDSNIISDLNFVKAFEEKFNINVNWINISKIYNEIVKLDSALYNKSNDDDILTSLYQMNVINIIKKHVIDFLCEKYNAQNI